MRASVFLGLVPRGGLLLMALPAHLARYQPLVDHLIEEVVQELLEVAEEEKAPGVANSPGAVKTLNTICPEPSSHKGEKESGP